MSMYYDEKGKFYTNFISKDTVEAVIHTSTHRITGRIYVRSGERVSDELNKAESFLAVTDATVYNPDGEVLYRSPFLAINRNNIVWLIPKEDEKEDQPGDLP